MEFSNTQKCTSVVVLVVSIVYLLGVRQDYLPGIVFQYKNDDILVEPQKEMTDLDRAKSFLEKYGVTDELFDLQKEMKIAIIEEKVREISRNSSHQPLGDEQRLDLEEVFRSMINNIGQDIAVKKVDAFMKRETEDKTYLFPEFVRLDPGKVGDEVEIELMEGKTHKRITRAVHPPIFEIPDFLTDEECDYMIERAKEDDITPSSLFGSELKKTKDEGGEGQEQTLLRISHLGKDFSNNIQSRVATLMQIPVDVMSGNEPIQAVHYEPEGHYHAHTDGTDRDDQPCCTQKICRDTEGADCCRVCRFATVLYYLNDVEEGGETAFPLADCSDDELEEHMKMEKNNTWINLSVNCYNSAVVVPPKKGKAVLWYNHFIDDNGYLGKPDERSYHGDCDTRKGIKWVANTWISGSPYQDRHKRSYFFGST